MRESVKDQAELIAASFVVRTDLTDDQDRQVGQTTQTQAVITPRPAG